MMVSRPRVGEDLLHGTIERHLLPQTKGALACEPPFVWGSKCGAL